MRADLIKKTGMCVALIAAAATVGAPEANAQYWQAANQLQSLVAPALSGSGAYRGVVEVTGLAGVGSSKLNHVEISTSQGYQYRSWFYMGAGLGVDIVRSSLDDTPGSYEWNHGRKRTGVMIPVFTDFRFDIGAGGGTSMFIDLRLGASWLCGSNYIAMDDGYLTNNSNFYFRPAVGVRIPLTENGKQAINFGVAYQLLTSGNNYWYSSRTQTINSIGATVAFEW